ncbi:sulfotransferase [Sphingomonas sp. Y38-1Y]|uniref:sulfotransferase family protein n=1 Tax=Sphingomonas sp. Y38-1Y TaxID=3078265 RepID=UPI0028E54F35|nr:sulfotransferase [Sphingomonas sp. Y38-1Y]
MVSPSAAPPLSSSDPATSHHREPARLRAANAALHALWDRGWATTPSLNCDALIGKASAKAGAAPDEDRVGWRDRLAILCEDLEAHAGLSDLGRTIAHGQLVSALTARFRAHALWRRHPEIADLPITRPIIIVGQMRSGSTRMQRLLACDPRLTFTRFFESWNPVPGSGIVDTRRLKGWTGLKLAHLLNPAFGTIHPTASDAPDEEIGLHSLSIFGSAFEAQWRVPTYTAAIEEGDAVAVYREFRHLLQTLAWLRGGAETRPWVLKVPQFTQDLPAILRVFPDARLIRLRRDLGDVVASSASLVCNQMQVQSRDVDPDWVAREWARKVQLRHDRSEAAFEATTAPRVEVGYDELSGDWTREMRRVYRMLDMPLPADVLDRMQRYLETSDPSRRKRHDYRAVPFGGGAEPKRLDPIPAR